MKKTQMFYYILVFFLVFTSCQKDEQTVPAKNQTQVTPTLTQEQMRQISELKRKLQSNEIPPVSKESSQLKSEGLLTASYSQSNNNFYFTCCFNSYFHQGNDLESLYIVWHWNVYNPATGGVDYIHAYTQNATRCDWGWIIIRWWDYFNRTYSTQSDTWLYLDAMVIGYNQTKGTFLIDKGKTEWFHLTPYKLL